MRRGSSIPSAATTGHVAHGLPQAGAGKGVEADEGEAVGLKALADDAHQRRADGIWRPRVDAMRDDDVEVAERAADTGEVERMEGDVRSPALPPSSGALRRSPVRRVDPDEFRAGRGDRHGDEVDPLAAADVQDARGADGRDLATEQGRNRPDRGGVGLAVDLARVADVGVGHARPF